MEKNTESTDVAVETGTPEDTAEAEKSPAAPSSVSSGTDTHWRQLAVACLGLLALVNGGLAIHAYVTLAGLKQEINESLWRTEQRYESLDAQVDFRSRRRQLLLGLRDEILATNPDLDWSEAYHFAALAVGASEKYASVDPVLLVSIGIVESAFDPRAESVAGARGVYQLFPSTARLLARSLGWEYDDGSLFDPSKSTELASLYLETLFAAHGDPVLALTEYKQGALQAGYLRVKRGKSNSERDRYLTEVMDTYQTLVAKHGTLRGLDGEGTVITRELEDPPSSPDGKRVDAMMATGAP